MFGEFMGTMVLVLLGDGVVASVVLKRTKAENAGWIVVVTGWAFAVMAGVFTAIACGSPDAHLNPAITFALAVKNHDFSRLLPYAVAQIAGAFAGACLVWVHFFPHWRETPDPGAKLGVFCTIPAIRNLPANVGSEILGTAVLVLVVGAIGSKLVLATGAAQGLSPYLVACVVWSIGLSLGATTGYAINPARDLGPRLAHALLPIPGKGISDWAYALVPIAGPLIGGGIAGLFLRFLGA
jgi:glycerol uptake facilitator protein